MSTALLQATGLAKAFDANKVLQDVQFELAPGEIVGLLGPNGSGKSTLLNIVSGFEKPDRGDVRLDGRSITSLSTCSVVARGLVRTFQMPAMPQKMSVLEVAMAASTREHGVLATLLRSRSERQTERECQNKAVALLETLLLSHVSHLPASAVSGGQKKLLGIVCALMAEPRLLMFDEPTAGVHANLRRDIAQALQRLNAQGMTMVIVEHDMHFVRDLCTRCLVLDQGRIVASCRPDELLSNERVVQAYLGAGVEGKAK